YTTITTELLPPSSVHPIFFFYCYGHHRDLHSFPTRRSSDLDPDRRRHWQVLVLGLQYGHIPLVSKREPGAPAGVPGLVPVPAHQDRKSTRLNSSHRTISYAVFCLKKKKQNHNTALF